MWRRQGGPVFRVGTASSASTGAPLYRALKLPPLASKRCAQMNCEYLETLSPLR